MGQKAVLPTEWGVGSPGVYPLAAEAIWTTVTISSLKTGSYYGAPAGLELTFQTGLFKTHRDQPAPAPCGGQRTTFGSQFSPFAVWIVGIELRLSDLTAVILHPNYLAVPEMTPH